MLRRDDDEEDVPLSLLRDARGETVDYRFKCIKMKKDRINPVYDDFA